MAQIPTQDGIRSFLACLVTARGPIFRPVIFRKRWHTDGVSIVQRDKKLGLALGILLIGIVAAFFFRNESETGSDAPQLMEPQKLDDEISQKPFAPYLTDLEIDEPQPASGQLPSGAFSKLSGTNQHSAVWDQPDVPTGDDAFKQWPAETGPPDPIDNHPSERAIVIPRHNQAWDVVSEPPDKDRSTSAKLVSTQSAAQFLLYRIQKGDTLSVLAQRFLGSSIRFLEIFEVNRSILKSPNDLPVGKQIRIPQPGHSQGPLPHVGESTDPKSSETTRTIESDHTVTIDPVSSGRQTGAVKDPPPQTTDGKHASDRTSQPLRRFLPVRRPPLAPRSSPGRTADFQHKFGNGQTTTTLPVKQP